MVARYEHRISKLEDQLGTPGCVCGDRPCGMVLLLEFTRESTPEEIEAFERRAHWTCPTHGPCRAALVLRGRCSHSPQIGHAYQGAQYR